MLGQNIVNPRNQWLAVIWLAVIFFGSIGGTFYRTALASRTAGFGSPPMDHFQQAMVSNAKPAFLK